jgi:hypothetical protein
MVHACLLKGRNLRPPAGRLGGCGPLEGSDPWRVRTVGGFRPLEGADPWRVQTRPASKKKPPLNNSEEALVFTAAAA